MVLLGRPCSVVQIILRHDPGSAGWETRGSEGLAKSAARQRHAASTAGQTTSISAPVLGISSIVTVGGEIQLVVLTRPAQFIWRRHANRTWSGATGAPLNKERGCPRPRVAWV